jgi:ADP-ribosylglycohydrolase
VSTDEHSFESRIQRARLALEGLSVGDAFGQCHEPSYSRRKLMPGPWAVTDDTMMAWSLVNVLESRESIDQDLLAAILAERYDDDPSRGYGHGMHKILAEISAGRDWDVVSPQAFSGQGSKGNGGAMRAAPLGAFFADDLDQVIIQAARSAVVTHTHPEAAHGAVAIAVGAALAWQKRSLKRALKGRSFLAAILQRTPNGTVRKAIELACHLAPDTSAKTAAKLLGNGSRALALDTVPLALWIAAHHLTDYEKALWTVVRVGADRDTLAAMVGAIISQVVGYQGLPWEWRQRRENYEALEPTPLFSEYEESDEENTLASAES